MKKLSLSLIIISSLIFTTSISTYCQVVLTPPPPSITITTNKTNTTIKTNTTSITAPINSTITISTTPINTTITTVPDKEKDTTKTVSSKDSINSCSHEHSNAQAGRLVIDPLSGLYSYKRVWFLSPSIGAPLVRINSYKTTDPTATAGTTSKTTLAAFNSLSIGAVFNYGSLIGAQQSGKFSDSSKISFKNLFGFGGGIMFAYNGTQNSGNVFAPFASVNFLDFQLFCGYDFGTVPNYENRTFMGIAYNITLGSFNIGTDVRLTRLRNIHGIIQKDIKTSKVSQLN
jgi:hypothetical protein